MVTEKNIAFIRRLEAFSLRAVVATKASSNALVLKQRLRTHLIIKSICVDVNKSVVFVLSLKTLSSMKIWKTS